MVYRDVKLENVLLDGSSPPMLQLCDFGVARHVADSRESGSSGRRDFHVATLVGTPGFLAPQVIGAYIAPQASNGGWYDGAKADVWSVGVLLFAMLLEGGLPFDRATINAEVAADTVGALSRMLTLQQGDRKLERRLTAPARHVLKRLSPQLQSLLRGMLETSEDARLTMDEVAEHPWRAHRAASRRAAPRARRRRKRRPAAAVARRGGDCGAGASCR